MNKQLTLLLLLLPYLAMSAAFTDILFTTNVAEAQLRASREERMYFVHFTATWCAPCQWMEEHTFTDELLANYVQDYYVAVKIDFDDPNAIAYKKRYQVTNVPSLLIFNAKGELLDRYETSLGKDELLQVLQKNYNKSNLPPRKTAATVIAVKNARVETGVISRPALIPDEANLAFQMASNAEKKASTIQQHNATSQDASLIVKNIYSIQVGVFSDYVNAKRFLAHMNEQFEQPVQIVENYQNDKKLYKVMLGKFAEKAAAEKFLGQLENQNVKGFVRNIEN